MARKNRGGRVDKGGRRGQGRGRSPGTARSSGANPKAQPIAEHPFVVAYVKQLDSELGDLPRAEKQVLLDRALAEFEKRLAHLDDPTDKQVLAVSAALGRPRDVAIASGLISGEDGALSRKDSLLSRGMILVGLAGLALTLYSSMIAVILGAVTLVLLLLALPRWGRVKNAIVVSVILVVAIGIVVAVQLAGAAQVG